MARTSYELRSFRRIFFLFLSLVVVPSAGLSGFGVLAIKNERAALNLRVNSALEEIEKRLTEELARTLDELNPPTGEAGVWMATKRAANPLYGTALLFDETSERFLLDEFSVPNSGHAPKTASTRQRLSQSLLPRARELVTRGAGYFQFEEGPLADAILAARRLGQDLVFVYQVDEPTLRARLQALSPQDLATTYDLRRAGGTESGRFFTMLAEMMRSPTEGDREPFATRRLAPPLADFELVASLADGLDKRVQTSRTIYLVLLIVFYLALILGTLLVGRALLQEARLSKLKTDFVSALSHDLRTPLTSIRIFVETLAMGRATPEESQECLKLLTRETERLSTMIERVLDWSRIESGRKIYRLRAVPPAELIDAALTAFRTHQRAAGHPFDESLLEVRLGRALPEVMADPEAISGVLLNLLENALKYSGGDQKISVQIETLSSKVVRFSVSDTGKGIPKSDLKRIFEQFYRADDLLSRRTEGSGLGLAIAKRIIESHKGKISVTSEPDKGSTFHFTLPRADF